MNRNTEIGVTVSRKGFPRIEDLEIDHVTKRPLIIFPKWLAKCLANIPTITPEEFYRIGKEAYEAGEEIGWEMKEIIAFTSIDQFNGKTKFYYVLGNQIFFDVLDFDRNRDKSIEDVKDMMARTTLFTKRKYALKHLKYNIERRLHLNEKLAIAIGEYLVRNESPIWVESVGKYLTPNKPIQFKEFDGQLLSVCTLEGKLTFILKTDRMGFYEEATLSENFEIPDFVIERVIELSEN